MIEIGAIKFISLLAFMVLVGAFISLLLMGRNLRLADKRIKTLESRKQWYKVLYEDQYEINKLLVRKIADLIDWKRHHADDDNSEQVSDLPGPSEIQSQETPDETMP